jgi:hypothetical protein
MKHYYLLFLLFILTSPIFTQGLLFKNPIDQSIGRTGALGDGPWSFFSNPSGIASTKTPSAGFGYHSGFHIKELGSRAAFASIPTSLLTGAAGFTHFGFEHFNIQQYALATARQIAPWLQMGVRVSYFLRQQTGSERLGITTLDAGLQIKPDPRVSLGFFVINPARVKWKLQDWDEYQPSFVAAAIAYKPAKEVSLELGVLKNDGFATEASFAIEAPIHKLVTLRGAAVTNPLRLGFGSSFLWQSFGFDVGFNHHATLGFSSTFGLVFYLPSFARTNSPQL